MSSPEEPKINRICIVKGAEFRVHKGVGLPNVFESPLFLGS